jgi:hypothetical protein
VVIFGFGSAVQARLFAYSNDRLFSCVSAGSTVQLVFECWIELIAFVFSIFNIPDTGNF